MKSLERAIKAMARSHEFDHHIYIRVKANHLTVGIYVEGEGVELSQSLFLLESCKFDWLDTKIEGEFLGLVSKWLRDQKEKSKSGGE